MPPDLHAIAAAERDRRADRAIRAHADGKISADDAQQDHMAWCSVVNLFEQSPRRGELHVDNATLVRATRDAAIKASAAQSARAGDLWLLHVAVAAQVRIADAVNAALREARRKAA